MQAEQLNLITTHLNKLIEITEVRSLATLLVNNHIFTPTEFSNIFSNSDERYNKQTFFKEFQNKGEAAFELLVQWLNSSGYSKLARQFAAGGSGITPFIYPAETEEEEEEEDEDEITSSIEVEEPLVDNSTTPLEIKVALANEFRDSNAHNPNIPFYRCRSKQRGRVLIINNYYFPGTNHKTRTGAEVDEVNLEHLFKQMGGWVVKKKTNLTTDEMRKTLRSFTKEKRERRCDICFVFIMSHGSEKLNETIIFGTDGTYLKTSQIQEYFTNSKCSLYRGKPKVFIYQVCRGDDLDLPMTFIEVDGKQKLSQPQPNTRQQSIETSRAQLEATRCHFRPVEDMLIGYATMQGSKAHRDPFRGTWYIELICQHFMELAKCESVDNILVKVDFDLRRRISEYRTVQTAEHIFWGFKKLYLNPGVYEDNGKLKKFFNNDTE